MGRNRTLNKNLTQLNFLTNLTDCCVQRIKPKSGDMAFDETLEIINYRFLRIDWQNLVARLNKRVQSLRD